LFVKVLASMPTSAALLHYREDFEAVIAALPADQIDQAQLEDARGLIADAIARTRPSVATRFLLNVLAVILFAAACYFGWRRCSACGCSPRCSSAETSGSASRQRLRRRRLVALGGGLILFRGGPRDLPHQLSNRRLAAGRVVLCHGQSLLSSRTKGEGFRTGSVRAAGRCALCGPWASLGLPTFVFARRAASVARIIACAALATSRSWLLGIASSSAKNAVTTRLAPAGTLVFAEAIVCNSMQVCCT
jgi:hypothetical protein